MLFTVTLAAISVCEAKQPIPRSTEFANIHGKASTEPNEQANVRDTEHTSTTGLAEMDLTLGGLASLIECSIISVNRHVIARHTPCWLSQVWLYV